tara:strand:- start:88 stop:924 length:837 start_codon:yes stop_codon:yes gene_type:complete
MINNGIKRTLSGAILEILAKEYPLRIKSIQEKLKENYPVKVSFQAIRKSLLSMVSDGRIIKKENNFYINKKWARHQKIFTDTLVKNYFVGENPNNPPQIHKIGTDFQSFSFENSLQADKFVGTLLLDIADTSEEKELCIQALHWWYFLGHFGTESDFSLEMQKRNTKLHYLSFGKSYFLDEMATDFYHQHNVKFKVVTKNLDENYELIAIKDFVIRVHYPDSFIEKLEEVFKKTTSIKNIDYLALGELIHSNFGEINLTIFRDKTVAEGIRENILKNF